MNALRDIQKQISAGESEILELKRSTGQLNPAGKTLCAFLNGQGGKVVIGARDTGKLVGQVVSDKTRRELATMLDRFEPPTFEDRAGAMFVTFRAQILPGVKATPQVTPHVAPQVTPQVTKGCQDPTDARRAAEGRRAQGPQALPQGVPRSPGRGGPARDDDPGQAAQLAAALPHDRGGRDAARRGGRMSHQSKDLVAISSECLVYTFSDTAGHRRRHLKTKMADSSVRAEGKVEVL